MLNHSPSLLFLDIPIRENPRRRSNFDPILSEFRVGSICGVANSFCMDDVRFSQNYVLNSIPLFYFSFYKAPKIVINEIIRI